MAHLRFIIIHFFSLRLFTSSQNIQPRETIYLDGLWKFKISPKDDQEVGFREAWFKHPFEDYLDMPVPSSYNDVTTNSTVRDYIGWAWYQRNFKLPASMQFGGFLRIRFESVHYFCKVWIDGVYAGEHEGGHIPFEFNWPTDALKNKEEPSITPLLNITVAVNSTLTNWTIPQGRYIHQSNISMYPPGYTSYSHDFDYFDYAGINGHVLIFKYFELIKAVQIKTLYNRSTGTGFIDYRVIKVHEDTPCFVALKDMKGKVISTALKCSGVIEIPNAILWWPAHCGYTPVGYLYTLKVDARDDSIERQIGIRTVTWNDKALYINYVPVYLRGFGMHQDAEIRGRGFDLVQTTRDMNLLEWIGANAVRTSHYPYPQEFIDFADRKGIMVIFESPACSLSNFDDKMLVKHESVMSEIFLEFGHHASIVMWSLANEPSSNLIQADSYFQRLVAYIKVNDITRPVTFVTSQLISNEQAVQHVDIICLNKYKGWYTNGGELELIKYQTINELRNWFDKYQKPVIMTEFGAGALSGLHTLPSSMWSEDYQIDLFQEHFKAFDVVQSLGFLVGEMVWNFADFNTPQEYIRPGACRKGVFTRNRQPKSAAYALKQRFESLRSYKNWDKWNETTTPSVEKID